MNTKSEINRELRDGFLINFTRFTAKRYRATCGNFRSPIALNRGVTLIELMVVMSILIIALAISVPSLRSFVVNNQRAAAVNEMATAFNLARSEALKRAQTVSVCRVSDANANAPACLTGPTWNTGWIVFVDGNNNASIDAGDEIIRRYTGLPTLVSLNSDNNSGQVRFGQLGTAQGSAATFAYCDERGAAQGRSIEISNQGRVQTGPTNTCTP